MDATVKEWIGRLHDAAETGRPLCIRGGGSKDFYGQPPAGEVLDTSAYRGIVAYEPTELVVVARAGTPLAELEATLAERGQCLPFEPPHFGASGTARVGDRTGADPCTVGGGVGAAAGLATVGESFRPAPGRATVGGMVAAGLSGPRRASVGAVRDYVLGVKMIDGQGELLSFGGQVMKNVAGYDVPRLMTGSLGTLGLVAEVALKVLPLPVAGKTLRFAIDEAEALRKLNDWGGKPLPIAATAWHDGALSVRLSGAAAAVAAAQQALGGDEVADADAFWQSLRDQTHAFFAGQAASGPLWRLSVASVTPPLPLAGNTLLEWGGAQRWLRGDFVAQELRTLAARCGGHATLFRADAAQKAAVGAFQPLSPALMKIHRNLKQAFDPSGVFNRGRLYAEI